MIDVPEGRCDLKCLDERRCIHECRSLKLCVFPWIRVAEFISSASPRVSVVFLTLACTVSLYLYCRSSVDATPLRFFQR